MDLANSSIWDSETGFGGDGDPLGEKTVGEGRCVTDGPFTGLRPIIYNHTYTSHCVSRGFRDQTLNITGRLPGGPYNPESIGKILRKQTYKEFVKAVENKLHNTLHQAVNGDFKAMTAANGEDDLVPGDAGI
jgi:tyrosinase